MVGVIGFRVCVWGLRSGKLVMGLQSLWAGVIIHFAASSFYFLKGLEFSFGCSI